MQIFHCVSPFLTLQSARGVWRQSPGETESDSGRSRCNLHGACGGKDHDASRKLAFTALQSARGVWRQSPHLWTSNRRQTTLQSARGVWRQRCTSISSVLLINRCNLHGACGGKGLNPNCSRSALSCNLHGACGGKDNDEIVALVSPGCNLHGACGGKVSGEDIHFVNLLVAICTGRVEDLAPSP